MPRLSGLNSPSDSSRSRPLLNDDNRTEQGEKVFSVKWAEEFIFSNLEIHSANFEGWPRIEKCCPDTFRRFYRSNGNVFAFYDGDKWLDDPIGANIRNNKRTEFLSLDLSWQFRIPYRHRITKVGLGTAASPG